MSNSFRFKELYVAWPEQRHLIIYILVKTGPKHDRTDRKNISVKSAHWLRAKHAMTDARTLVNSFDTRNMIG